MNIDKWMQSYKIRAFPWIDGRETIYFNVQYYKPGQSISKAPAWDKTVYIKNNEAGRNLLENYLDSLVNYISKMTIPEKLKTET